MNKKLTTVFSVLIVIAFIAYIIYDSSHSSGIEKIQAKTESSDTLQDRWSLTDIIPVTEGSLRAISVAQDGNVIAGGVSFISIYGKDHRLIRSIRTDSAVISLCTFGDTIFASTHDQILVYTMNGRLAEEWGPFESKSYITSVSANSSYIAYADAGNRMIVILDRKGRVERIIGQNDGQFIVPSPYFDIAISKDGNLIVANTGQRRIETRSASGELLSMFGEPGTAPEAFCGCCNPAHFAIMPEGFVTAEKGINRIKILDRNGRFVEFVSSKNKFLSSEPLDVAVFSEKVIYAANPADSRIYKFIRGN